MSGAAPCVGVFRLQLFKRSESFIASQAEALARYRPIYLGRRRFGIGPAGAEVVTPRTGRGSTIRIMALADPEPWVRALGGRRLDILHAHFGPDAVYALPLARRLGVPLVVTLHGFDVSRSRLSLLLSLRPALVRMVLGWSRISRGAARIIAVSQAVQAAARGRGAPAARLLVLPVGVDLHRLQPAGGGEPGLVVHVGRLVEKKGAEVLLAAFERVSASHPAARLAIIGDGPLKARLQKRAGAGRAAGRIAFLGALEHGAALGWLARAAAVAIPSRTARNGDAEGLPTVLLEAAALGRAVVASDLPCMAEVVRSEESALLTPPGDVEALAAALARVLADPVLAAGLGAAARRAVEAGHDLRRQTERLEAVYDAVRRCGHGD